LSIQQRNEPGREPEEDRQIGLFEYGTYVLVLQLTRYRIVRVGSLGRIRLARGYYAYVGSARRHMRSRVARHFAREKKKRWHIDWLTTQSGVVPIAVASTMLTGLECRIAAALSSRADLRVSGFGCSDCKCESHLFYFSGTDGLLSALGNLRRYGVSVQRVRMNSSGRAPLSGFALTIVVPFTLGMIKIPASVFRIAVALRDRMMAFFAPA